MAGAGYKVFTAGDILSAADVSTYLMDQSVMVFDNATDRTAAIGTPSAGMMSFRTDATALEIYSGSSWVSANSLGGALAGSLVSGSLTNATIASTKVLQTVATSTDVASQNVETADSGELWVMNNNSTAGTVVFGTATAFATGGRLDIVNNGTATVTIASSGVEVYGAGTAGTAYTIPQYDACSVVCVASNKYRIIGNVTAI